MAIINIIRGNAPPESEQTDQLEISSSKFSVKIDGELHEPAVVTNIEIENDPSNSTTSDQCGHTSRQRTTDGGWIVRVQGIVTGNDDRYRNLSMQMLRDVVASADTVEVRSDVYSGEQVVSNVVITQPNDLHSVETPDTWGKEQAFEFQLQLGEEDSE